MKTTITMMLLLMNFLLCYSCENKELETITEQPQTKSTTSNGNTSSILLTHEQKQHTFSNAAGGTRGYYISVPEDYDETKQYRLLFVFAGTDSTGEFMQTWMGQGWNSNTPGLEKLMDNTIFVYPDQKYNWGNVKGWALGSYAAPYDGMHDIQFTKELLELIKNDYSIDANRIFATGHSWGGDMANVTAYFLKGTFKAVAPIASNKPFWFRDNGNYINDPDYHGNTAVWIFFGLNDDHFGSSSINGDFGIQQKEFWLLKNGGNENTYTTNPIGSLTDITKTYPGTSEVKLTLYDSDQYSGGGVTLRAHQPPDYYFKAVTDWFKTF
jgi:polyhydroxybutyrate depolymerase